MNKKLLALAATGLLCATGVSAHDFEVDGIYYNIMSEEDKTVEVTYQGDAYGAIEEYSGAVSIPATVTYDGMEYSVTSIGYYGFCYCLDLTSVEIPNSVTSIGDNAFSNCKGLVSLIIPGSVTNIDNAAFFKCINLTSVVIQDGVERIGLNAFQFCEKLEVVELPASVTSIGGSAFADCENLELIQVAPENEIYCSFNSNGIWGVYSKDMSELIAVPAGTTGEFVISETVKSLNDSACDGCKNLTSVVIPASVSHIGDYAFADCEGITSITSNIPADKLFSISGTVFDKVDKTNITLNVPYGAQAAYASKEGWSDFTNIVEMDPTPFDLTVSSAGYATLYLDYTAQIPEGVEVYTANEVEGNLLKMELVEGVLPANTGVVVKAPAGTYTFTYSDAYAPEISDNLFKGSATYEYVDVASTQTAFVLSKVDGEVGMYPAKLTDGRFLNNANKAYLLITKLGLSDEELDTSVGGAQLSLRFDFGGTTGVDKVQTESGADAIIYDLYGRKVNKATTPGFYIINNKKVWVK